MKNKFLILFLIFNISCQNESNQNNLIGSEDLTESPIETNDSSKCPQGFECEEQCEELFNLQNKRQECMQLSENEVNALYHNLTENLHTPIGSFDLNSITDFKNIVDQGAQHWSQNIQDYTTQDSQRVLSWLVQKRAYTQMLSASSEQYASGIFSDLIESIGTPLESSLDFLETTRENIILKAERLGNDDALRLLHEHFVKECPTSQYSQFGGFQQSACVLGKLYCEDGGRKFQEIYLDLLSIDSRLHSFIVNQNGLNFGDDFRDYGEVCENLCERAECSS